MSAPGDVGARRAAADIAVQLLSRVASLALGIVVTLVIARLLGDEGFGRWATIYALTSIAMTFGDLGLEQVAVRRAAAAPEEEARWLGALVTLRVALGVPAFAISALAAVLLIDDADGRIAGVLIAGTLLVGAPSALRVVFQLRVRNDVTSALLFANSVGWAAIVVVIAALDGGIVELAAGLLAITAVSAAAHAWLAVRRAPVALAGARDWWGPLLRVGVPVALGGLLVVAYVRLDQILVYEIAGADAAGDYGAAYRILDQAQLVPAAVMTTLFPVIAAAYPADAARVRVLLQRVAEYLAMASLGALAFAVVASEPLIRLLFGGEFEGAAEVLPILLAAFVSISFGYLCGNMVIILELQRRFIAYAGAGLVVNVVLNVLLIPAYGAVGAAWVTLATELVVLGLTARAVLHVLDMRLAVGRLARVAAAAGAMAAGVAALRSADVPVGGLLAAGALLYAVAIFTIGGLRRDEIAAVLRKQPV